MRRLLLTTAATALASLALASPSWAAWVWPLSGPVITPYSNGSDPYAGGQHRGIDIAGETGQPVVAAAGGSVRFAGTAGSSGLTVSIRTTDGFDTSYLHLSSASVRAGQTVAGGERVGAVGISGTRSTEHPHLHFGVREAGSRHAYRDPLAFLPGAPPVADGPGEAPAPQSAPVPVAPRSVPAPVSAGERAPARRGAIPRRAEAERRAAAGRREPARAGAPVAESGRQGSPAAPPAPVPRATSPSPARPEVQSNSSRGPEPNPQRGPRSAPNADLAKIRPASPPASRAPKSPARAVAAAQPDPEPADPPPGGPDLGLLLACVGLLGAAVVLGLSEDGRTATRRTGQRAAGLLRPLLGRR